MTRARDVANIDGILTTTGDTFYASAAATPARLGVGSTGQVLTVASGVPSWATPTASTSGLTKITSGTFTGQTSVSIDSCFSATYRHYKIFFKGQSANNTVSLRFRTSGSDVVGTAYTYGYAYIAAYNSTSALTCVGNSGQGQAEIAKWSHIGAEINIFNPFDSSERTHGTWITSAEAGTGAFTTGGLHYEAYTSFDGIKFIFGAALDGAYTIFGVQN